MHLCSAWGVEWRFVNRQWFAKDGTMPGRIEFLIDGSWKMASSLDEDYISKLKEK